MIIDFGIKVIRLRIRGTMEEVVTRNISFLMRSQEANTVKPYSKSYKKSKYYLMYLGTN